MSEPISSSGARIRHRSLWSAAAITAVVCWAVGAVRGVEPVGGDVPAYLLAARYGPLAESFDNPSHGWGYPLVIRLASKMTGVSDLDACARGISAVSAAAFVLFGGALLRSTLPAGSAAIGMVLLVAHPALIDMGSKGMSDMLFAAMVGAVAWTLFLRGAEAEISRLAPVVLAGALAMMACFVRGNGMALVLAAPLGLIFLDRGKPRRALGFLSGVVLTIACVAVLFRAEGLPPRSMFRSGAGEIAFATLDETDTWLHRHEYERVYPDYLTLVRKIGKNVLRAALRTIYHVHEWWLLVAFPALGVFIVPGLLVWIRRMDRKALALTSCLLALQATALWSGKFQEARHLLAVLPWLTALAILGVSLLPRRVALDRVGVVPLRMPILLMLAIASLGLGAPTIQKMSIRPEPLALAMQRAGNWLRSNAEPGDSIAATRLNLAYTAGVRPAEFVEAFGTTPPPRQRIVPALQAVGCRWLAWIPSHSALEYPGLAWLAEETPDGARLDYDSPEVRIWSIPAGRAGRQGSETPRGSSETPESHKPLH